MSKGQYVIYERASRDEERMFLDIAKKVIDGVGEPKDWKSKRDLKKHAGGRPIACSFRQMLLILLLMVYHRKEYREMEAHLKNNPALLNELGLNKAPSKSSIHRAAGKTGIGTLVKMNDAIIARFKKVEEELERSM